MRLFESYIFLITLFIVISSGCNDDPFGPSETHERYIIGKVTDTNGKPIDGVDIHYIFYLEKYLFQNYAYIKYSLRVPKKIYLRIHNNHNTVIAGYHGIIAQPGEHILELDLANFTNGIYMYEIEGEDSAGVETVGRGKFLVFNKQFGQMFGLNPVIHTTKFGKFQLFYSELGIGQKFPMIINGEYQDLIITDSIDVVIYKKNYMPLIESFKIIIDKIIRKTFVLSEL